MVERLTYQGSIPLSKLMDISQISKYMYIRRNDGACIINFGNNTIIRENKMIIYFKTPVVSSVFFYFKLVNVIHITNIQQILVKFHILELDPVMTTVVLFQYVKVNINYNKNYAFKIETDKNTSISCIDYVKTKKSFIISTLEK